MPLQIRRGTDAERLGSFTPAEGELIYTTDTKKLYVGDGITPGGVAIDTVGGGGGGASTLNDLTNVDVTGAIAGSVLKYDSVNWVVGVDTTGMSALADDTAPALGGNLALNSFSITGTGNINITGDVLANVTYSDTDGDHFGDVFADDGITKLLDATLQQFNGSIVGNVTGDLIGNVTGTVTGDITGSLFADSSQLLVDGVNSIVVGDIDNESITTENLSINKTTSPRITLELSSTGDLSSYSGLVADLGFDTQDSNGNTSYGRIQSWTTGMIIAANDDGSFPASTLNTFSKDGVAIGGVNPTAKLDVRGAIKPGVYANATARDTDITSPVEGMMVFLQDTQKMQVYVTDTGLAGSGPSNSTPGWHDIY